jgi:hypothetical protein
LAPIPVSRQSFAILTWVSGFHTTLRYADTSIARSGGSMPNIQRRKPRPQHVSTRVTDRYVNTIPCPFGGQQTSLSPRQQASHLIIGRLAR